MIPARWWISSAAPIPYALAAGGAQILVPADQVPQARVLLARQGLPSGGTVGYEIFDHTSGLGETDFQQRTDETRALERELARTIEAIRGVRLERVHVVLLQWAPFARTQDTAQASVTADDDGSCAAESGRRAGA